jgi:hypothetical protein
MYLGSVFGAPLATAVPVAAAIYFIRMYWLPGRTWPQLFTAAALCVILYFPMALFTCFDREHRDRVRGAADGFWRRLAGVSTAI